MRRNTILLLAAFIFLAATSPKQIHASELVARTSATQTTLPTAQATVEVDNRAEILKTYLERHGSPLAPYAQTFIDEADKNDIDWKIVPAIAGVESTFGQAIPPYSYNGWGYGVYGNNVRRFASWEDGIAVVSKALREDYMNNWGAQNIYQIGSKYAADPNWANKVSHYMDELEALESHTENTSLSISL